MYITFFILILFYSGSSECHESLSNLYNNNNDIFLLKEEVLRIASCFSCFQSDFLVKVLFIIDKCIFIHTFILCIYVCIQVYAYIFVDYIYVTKDCILPLMFSVRFLSKGLHMDICIYEYFFCVFTCIYEYIYVCIYIYMYIFIYIHSFM
jgi:hypothetical protein